MLKLYNLLIIPNFKLIYHLYFIYIINQNFIFKSTLNNLNIN